MVFSATFSYLGAGKEEVESWHFDGGRVGTRVYIAQERRTLRVLAERVQSI